MGKPKVEKPVKVVYIGNYLGTVNYLLGTVDSTDDVSVLPQISITVGIIYREPVIYDRNLHLPFQRIDNDVDPV